MFDNIGGKIKMLAKVICWGGIGISIIIALIMYYKATESYSDEEMYNFLGNLFFIGGTLLSWINSLLVYGFGELIDKVSEISNNNCRDKRNSDVQNKTAMERIAEIQRIRSKGLITEEEYIKAISKIRGYDN